MEQEKNRNGERMKIFRRVSSFKSNNCETEYGEKLGEWE